MQTTKQASILYIAPANPNTELPPSAHSPVQFCRLAAQFLVGGNILMEFPLDFLNLEGFLHLHQRPGLVFDLSDQPDGERKCYSLCHI